MHFISILCLLGYGRLSLWLYVWPWQVVPSCGWLVDRPSWLVGGSRSRWTWNRAGRKRDRRERVKREGKRRREGGRSGSNWSGVTRSWQRWQDERSGWSGRWSCALGCGCAKGEANYWWLLEPCCWPYHFRSWYSRWSLIGVCRCGCR